MKPIMLMTMLFSIRPPTEIETLGLGTHKDNEAERVGDGVLAHIRGGTTRQNDTIPSAWPTMMTTLPPMMMIMAMSMNMVTMMK